MFSLWNPFVSKKDALREPLTTLNSAKCQNVKNRIQVRGPFRSPDLWLWSRWSLLLSMFILLTWLFEASVIDGLTWVLPQFVNELFIKSSKSPFSPIEQVFNGMFFKNCFCSHREQRGPCKYSQVLLRLMESTPQNITRLETVPCATEMVQGNGKMFQQGGIADPGLIDDQHGRGRSHLELRYSRWNGEKTSRHRQYHVKRP